MKIAIVSTFLIGLVFFLLSLWISREDTLLASFPALASMAAFAVCVALFLVKLGMMVWGGL